MNATLKITALLLLSFWAVTAVGQEKLASLYLTSPVTNHNTIVRGLKETGFVSYVETASEHLFLRFDDTMGIVYTASIPLNFFVLDFEIYKSKAFFCGYNKLAQFGQEGMIGYFDIDSMCTFDSSFHLFDNFLFDTSTNLYVKTFTELEVYDKYNSQPIAGDSVSIIVIGSSNNNKKRHIIMEAIGPYNNPHGWRYAIGLNNDDYCAEIFEQVSLTNSYVVTGGILFNDWTSGVCFRALDKYSSPNIFSNIPQSYFVYRYPTDYTVPLITPAVMYPNKHFEMTAMDNDRIATMSVYDFGSYPVQPERYCGFLLNVYDMALTTSTPGVNCIYSMYDNFGHYYSPTRISDLQYNAVKDELVALLFVDHPNLGPASVCSIIPYSQPLTFFVPYYYLGGEDLNKVAATDYGTACLTSSHPFYSPSNSAEYYEVPWGAATNCSATDSCKVYPPNLFTSESFKYPLTVYCGNFGFDSKTARCLYGVLTKMCE